MADDFKQQLLGGGPAEGGQAEPEETNTPVEEPGDVNPSPLDGLDVIGGDEPIDQTPEGEPEPEEDEAKKRAAFYQDRHQKTMEVLKSLDPNVYRMVREQFKEPEKPADTPADPTSFDVDADFDPRVLMRKLDELPKTIEAAATKAQREAVLRDRYAQESSLAEQALRKFVGDHEVPDDAIKEALKEVQMLGIDTSQLGGPSAAARAVIKELQYGAVMQHLKGGMTGATAQAEQKAKAALLASQPGAGAAPAPKQKSKTAEILDMLNNAGKKDASREVFGTE